LTWTKVLGGVKRAALALSVLADAAELGGGVAPRAGSTHSMTPATSSNFNELRTVGAPAGAPRFSAAIARCCVGPSFIAAT
jgi:hypothetical protein